MRTPGKPPISHEGEHKAVHHRGARDEFDHLRNKKVPLIPKAETHDDGDHPHKQGKRAPTHAPPHYPNVNHDEHEHHEKKSLLNGLDEHDTPSRSSTPNRSRRI